MTSQLRATFELLANEFAVALVRAVRTAPVGELLDASAGLPATIAKPRAAAAKGGRRTAEDVSKTADAIVTVLKQHRSGLRAEQIRVKLELAKSDILRPIADLLATKKIVKTGERRGTVYFAK